MNETTEPKSAFNEYCLVELFGHQKIVGKVSEATLTGGAFLRVDVEASDGKPAFTRFYGPGAIYSINPVSPEVARDLMHLYRNEPVSRFDLPQIAEKCPEREVAPRLDDVAKLSDDDDRDDEEF